MRVGIARIGAVAARLGAAFGGRKLQMRAPDQRFEIDVELAARVGDEGEAMGGIRLPQPVAGDLREVAEGISLSARRARLRRSSVTSRNVASLPPSAVVRTRVATRSPDGIRISMSLAVAVIWRR